MAKIVFYFYQLAIIIYLMLTSDQTKQRIIALIVLNSIALAAVSGTMAVTIVGNYYGFSQATPITCTQAYFKLKFTSQNTFLSVSFVGAIVSVLCSIILLIDLIMYWSKVDKIEVNQINKITLESIIHFYILVSMCLIGCLVPLGYFGSIIIQARDRCGTSISINELIIASTAALAEILFIVCWIILVNISIELDESEQQNKEEEKVINVEQQIVKNQQAPKQLSIIKEISMIKEQEEKQSGKQLNKHMEGEILNDQEKMVPLLNKSIFEQQKQNAQEDKQRRSFAVPSHHQSQVRKSKSQFQNSEVKPFIHPEQQIERQKSVKKIDGNKTFKTYTRQQSKHQQSQSPFEKEPSIRIHKQPKKLHESKTKELVKAEKVDVQVKPSPNQNTTHVTINFPTMPHSSYLPQVANEAPGYSNESRKEKNGSKGKRRHYEQVIKQSNEEDQGIQSDESYQKRKKSKKRNFNMNRSKQNKSNKKFRNNQQPNQERQFEMISSRFKQTPSQPRYVLLSPQSVRVYQDFLKDERGNIKTINRNFSNSKEKQISPNIKQNLKTMRRVSEEQASEIKKQQHKNIGLQVKQQMKEEKLKSGQRLLKPQRKNSEYYQSDVKQFNRQNEKMHPKLSKMGELQKKQKSIYQKLNVASADEGDQLKKYKQFFKSSSKLQKQKPAQSNQPFEQYFNLLNSRVGYDNSYNSLTSYSSVLNQQKGKIPQQRENNTKNKINLDKNKVDPHKISGKNIIQKIRNKYH